VSQFRWLHILTARTLDGTYNDLERPWVGAAGTRFGRNVRIAASSVRFGA